MQASTMLAPPPAYNSLSHAVSATFISTCSQLHQALVQGRARTSRSEVRVRNCAGAVPALSLRLINAAVCQKCLTTCRPCTHLFCASRHCLLHVPFQLSHLSRSISSNFKHAPRSHMTELMSSYCKLIMWSLQETELAAEAQNTATMRTRQLRSLAAAGRQLGRLVASLNCTSMPIS